jgi:hypothetical protein
MASNLLSTNTTTLIELIGNGRRYQVPPYQRDYSWDEEQWEDLWRDVIELHSGSEHSPHYMGALVVEGTSDRTFQVIDGQQRLATLSILALAVVARLKELAQDGIAPAENLERSESLRRLFVGDKDPASLIWSSKLALNQTNDGFYQDNLVQLQPPLNPRGLDLSNKRLWRCFGYFTQQLTTLGHAAQDGEALARLLSETVGRRLHFILVTVADEVNAYTVFETLNARGMELSATDLLKNYLFSRVTVAADRAHLQRRWQALLGTVDADRFPELLRYHLLCEMPKVRTQRLFKLVRDRVRTPADVFALMDDLERRAELFAALADPFHGFWAELPEARPLVRELQLFGTRQMTPLLFAAWERMHPRFVSVLRLVSTLMLRYTVVGSRNTNAIEPISHRTARAVLEGKATSAAVIFGIANELYVQDDAFLQDFADLTVNTNYRRKQVARYLLAKLEEDASGHAVEFATDPFSIEHVLPQNPSGDWSESVASGQWGDYVFRLGNMTPLETGLNRAIGSRGYVEKVEAYRESSYVLTRRIPDLAPERWTREHIFKRQKALAERAVHIWRLDFGNPR